MATKRLNKYHKEAFVRAVLDDVPSRNYGEDARMLVQNYVLNHLPPDVRAVAESHPEFLVTAFYSLPGLVPDIQATSLTGCSYYDFKNVEACPEIYEELLNYSRQIEEQRESQNRIATTLYGILASCSTVKQALKLLPEFAKYLPEETEPTTQLPSVANVVGMLTQAGWPKDGQPVSN